MPSTYSRRWCGEQQGSYTAETGENRAQILTFEADKRVEKKEAVQGIWLNERHDTFGLPRDCYSSSTCIHTPLMSNISTAVASLCINRPPLDDAGHNLIPFGMNDGYFDTDENCKNQPKGT
jgi:hypothetical protein